VTQLFNSLKTGLNRFKRQAKDILEEDETLDDVSSGPIVPDPSTPEPDITPEKEEKSEESLSKKERRQRRKDEKKASKRSGTETRPVVSEDEEEPGTDDRQGEDCGKERGKRIKVKKLRPLLEELEMSLLESDVSFDSAENIVKSVEEELEGRRIKRFSHMGAVVEEALRNALLKQLTSDPLDFDTFVNTHETPVKILFVGVNGTGKTTAIARVAYRLQAAGKSVVMAAADTFRAGAIEQLQVHAERLGIRLIKHEAGGDPSAVAYDAIDHAKARNKDVVLIDTAGRMQNNKNLMEEMRKIRRVADPDMVLFVGDSLAGNDAVEQARTFHEVIGVDGIILTKIDVDAKGGAALSISHAISAPVVFIGTGQDYPDLEPFNAPWMVDRLLSGNE